MTRPLSPVPVLWLVCLLAGACGGPTAQPDGGAPDAGLTWDAAVGGGGGTDAGDGGDGDGGAPDASTDAGTPDAGTDAGVDAGPPASCGSLGIVIPFLQTDPSQTTLLFTGERFLSSGFSSNTLNMVVARIDVPSGISGPTTLSIFEYGAPSTFRKAWLSKIRCDMSAVGPPYRFSTTGPVFNLQVGGTPSATDVNMQAGETWWVMIKNEKPFNTDSSCTSGDCDIGIKLYPP